MLKFEAEKYGRTMVYDPLTVTLNPMEIKTFQITVKPVTGQRNLCRNTCLVCVCVCGGVGVCVRAHECMRAHVSYVVKAGNCICLDASSPSCTS